MVVITDVLVGDVINKLVGTAYDYIYKKVLDRLTESSMEEELGRLKKALPMIQSVVAATERGPVTMDEMDSGLRAWFWQLRDAVDAAGDLVDDIEYQKLDVQLGSDSKLNQLPEESDSKGVKVCCTAFPSKYFLKAVKRAVKGDPILDRLREVVKQLDELTAQVGNYLHLTERLGKRVASEDRRLEIARERESGCLPIEGKLFGRDKEKQEIIALLLGSGSDGVFQSSTSSVSVLAIVGVGGMGKTTLAQDVYNVTKVEGYFSKRMWICISNTFDVPLILGKIFESVSERSTIPQNFSTLQESLRAKLCSERFLLVLDDVWDDKHSEQWENLVAPLQYGQSGSKVLLTTRMDSVAMIAKRVFTKMARDVILGEEQWKIKLESLEDNEFVPLFEKYAFAGLKREVYRDFEPIGKDIAKKLGGVPLLAKVVGGLLNSSLDHDHWRSIRDNDVMKLEMSEENNILKVLKLSYENLPTHLRGCFRFCSIFPEDYKYEKEELVSMWIALGLIPVDTNQSEDTGKEFLNTLVRKSFFDENNDVYIMHDCLHRLGMCCFPRGVLG